MTSVRIIPALCIVTLGAVSSLLAISVENLQGNWVSKSFVTVLAAGIMATAALVQKWKYFAWLPVVAFAVACASFLAGQGTATSASYFAFTVLVVWHSHQKERAGGPHPPNQSA